MKKLLSIILIAFGVLIPMKIWAQNIISAPTFFFQGDSLVMTTDTQDAIIYYVMSEFANEEEAESLRENLDVSEGNSMRMVYTTPILVTSNVVIKAYAMIPQQQGESEITTLVYSYTAWTQLLDAIEYGSDVLARAQNNTQVSDDLKEQLKWALEEGQYFYKERGMMDYYEAEHFTQEIMDTASQIEAIIGQVPTEPEPYAVLSDDNTVLTFYYDENKSAYRESMGVGPFEYNDNVGVNSGWYEQRENITNVVFDASFANCTTLTSTAYWFYEFNHLTAITGISNLKTDNVTDMSYMFYNCWYLQSIDLSGFKTDNVKNMSNMFSYCGNLRSLDFSEFSTDNVTNMNSMFDTCRSLTSLDLSGFNTEEVTDMSRMFHNSGLTSLDASKINTINVTNMEGMFSECFSLTSLDLSGFNTEKVTDMSIMFFRCNSLANLDLSNFNTSNVTNMTQMFYDCSDITTIYVGSEWNTSMVESSTFMFGNCTSLVGGAGTHYDADHTNYTYAHIDGGTANPGYFTASGAEPWTEPNAEPYAVLSADSLTVTFYYDNQKAARGGMDINNTSLLNNDLSSPYGSATTVVIDASFADYRPTSTAFWFMKCSSLASIIGLENLYTDNVTNMHDMFSHCTSLTSLDLSNFNTSNVTEMTQMFDGDSGLISLNVSSFNTEKVTSMWGMFRDCSSLTSLDVSGFKTDNVTKMTQLFYKCSKLTSLDVSGFKTDKVTRIEDMFYNCSGLTSLDVSGFKVDKATYIYGMFQGCSGLTTLDLSGFNTEKVTEMYRLFSGCSKLKTIYVSNDWSTASVTRGDYMFTDCNSLVGGAGTHFASYHTDYTYAHIDGGTANPGYFTASGAEPWVDPEPYAVLSDNNTVLTFYYDNQKDVRRGLSVGPFNEVNDQSWFDYNGNITTVVFDPSFADCTTLTSTAHWLDRFYNLTTITNISNLKTDNVTDMSWMFYGCSKLTSLDVSNFKTDKVTDMMGLFSGCSGLKSLDVSNFKTENVTSMSVMFYNCSSLTSLDITNFKTDKVTSLGGMFNGCSGLKILDLSNFKTDKVSDMSYLFYGCTDLSTIFVGNDWSTASVTNSSDMFTDCTNLVGGRGTVYDPNHIDAGYAHIDEGTTNPGYLTDKNAPAPTEPEPYAVYEYNTLTFYYDNRKGEERGGWVMWDVNEERRWNTAAQEINTVVFDESFANYTALTSTSNWFRDFMNLTTITGITNLKTDNVTDMSNMFYNCSSLTSLDLSGFNTAKVTNIEQMFYGCESLLSINISNFNTSNVTSRNWLFAECHSLASIQAGYAGIPAEEYARIANPNLLVYVNNARLAPQGIQNVVINGVAEEIVLTDVTEGNNNWYCPQAFTAEKINYTRNFLQQTEVGISRGWESIALPFNVQTITHETQGQIVPFGAQGIGKNFWLRGYSPEGLFSATAIEANTPYLISMPNNTEVYPDEYNLDGSVTFAATNTTVPATPDIERMVITRGNITMAPVFQLVPQNEKIYAINVGQPLDRYPEGSVFARELREVRPFEVYTTHAETNGARPNYIRIGAQPRYDSTGIKTIESDSTEGSWYSLDGRKLSGVPKVKGIYIQNGKKKHVR